MEHERHDRGDGGAAAQIASVSSHMNAYVNGASRVQSPPWREDDKDGHYTFELGENITPRCNDPLNLTHLGNCGSMLLYRYFFACVSILLTNNIGLTFMHTLFSL